MKIPYCILILILTIDGQFLNEILSLKCNNPIVTLYVFSSQLNPTWKINQTEMKKVRNLANQILKKNEIEIISQRNSRRIMGYQGFSLSCENENELFLHGKMLIEEELLNTGKFSLSQNVINHVQQYLGESKPLTNSLKGLPRIDCNYVPIKGPDHVPNYNPLTDNGGCFITKQSKNNCYAYATDIVTNTYPQPGRSNGKSSSSITCESVKNASMRDGLIYKGIHFPSDQPKIGHYLALFIWPNLDYHWIRKDANGYWSHKPGPGHVTNRDNTGSFILNPLKSNFTPWRIFCAFYIAQPSKVHIY